MANWYRGTLVLNGTVDNIRSALRGMLRCYDGEEIVNDRIEDLSDNNGSIHFILPSDDSGWDMAWLSAGSEDGEVQINDAEIAVSSECKDSEVKLMIRISARNSVPLTLFTQMHEKYDVDVFVSAGEYMLDTMIRIKYKRENHYFMYEEQGMAPFVKEIGKVPVEGDGAAMTLISVSNGAHDEVSPQ